MLSKIYKRVVKRMKRENWKRTTVEKYLISLDLTKKEAKKLINKAY